METFDPASLGGWQWFAVMAAALFVGLSKTGIAGAGILMVPLLALALPARLSTGLILPILVMGDVLALLVYRREAQWPHVRRCLPWAIGGIVAGWAFYREIDPSDGVVKRLIGAIVIGMLLLGREVGRRAKVRREAEMPPASGPLPDASGAVGTVPVWFAALIGVTAGFTTMVANAAGPVWIVYLLALGLPKAAFLGTSAWAFFAINLIKVPFSWELDLIRLDSLSLNLWMLPALLLGAWLGVVIAKCLPQQWFNRAAAWLAALAALNLMW